MSARWPDGVFCPRCDCRSVVRDGVDNTQKHRQRYRCRGGGGRFDDLTATVLANHHQPLRVWVSCLYLMDLNLSNRQIALELDIDEDDAQAITSSLREGLLAKVPAVMLEGIVEIDEVYVVACHKGHPRGHPKKGPPGRRRRLKGARGRGTLEKEKPSILGLIQRGGQAILHMLPNVQQNTIKPIIEAAVAGGRRSIPTNTTSTTACSNGATSAKPSITLPANVPATKAATDSTRST